MSNDSRSLEAKTVRASLHGIKGEVKINEAKAPGYMGILLVVAVLAVVCIVAVVAVVFRLT